MSTLLIFHSLTLSALSYVITGTSLTQTIINSYETTALNVSNSYFLYSVNIGANIISIGEDCFKNKNKLAIVTFENQIMLSLLPMNCFSYCASLSTITIPSSVTTIGDACFNDCSSLKKITIPSSVSSIGVGCFQNCTEIVSVSLSPLITLLPSTCFYNCSKLTSINIPQSVTSIDSACFGSCTLLDSIKFNNVNNIINIASNSFLNISQNATFTLTGANDYSQLPQALKTFVTENNSYNYVYTFIVADVCFKADTKILTDQGLLNIQDLKPYINTIRNIKIIGITKTVLPDSTVTFIKKNALYNNVPNLDTIFSNNHKIFYKKQMYNAEDLTLFINDAYKIKYSGYYMYNIILEKNDCVIANNLICESLDLNNPIAQFFTNKFIKK